MKAHTKIYFQYFKYDNYDFIPCEVCGSRAVDIHHIDCRGMGSSNEKNNIENLMAVCRQCHIEYGDKKQYIDFLKDIHNKKIKR